MTKDDLALCNLQNKPIAKATLTEESFFVEDKAVHVTQKINGIIRPGLRFIIAINNLQKITKIIMYTRYTEMFSVKRTAFESQGFDLSIWMQK